MRMTLDPASPVPLYHQLAEALRYRLATGATPPGSVLPSLREAAEQWRVNLHTVRHAYAALAAQGLVRTDAPRGTVVLGGRATVAALPAGVSGATGQGGAAAGARRAGAGHAGSRRTASRPAADRFLAGVLREAETRFGLTGAEVGRRIALLDPGAGAAAVPVHVVECSETQAEDLASQLSARWNLTVLGWSLERPGEPPPGPVVATYFHYNDIRTRWPERFAAVHFVAIHPDPALAGRLARLRDLEEARSRDGAHGGGRGRRAGAAREQGRGRRRGPTKGRTVGWGPGRTEVLVCEREAAMARNIAADVKAILPADRFDVTARVESSPGGTLATAPRGTPVLFAPRVWAALSPERRADPRAMEIRYLIEPKDLAALGAVLGAAPAAALRGVRAAPRAASRADAAASRSRRGGSA
jgi:GntR family transcriptional regulator